MNGGLSECTRCDADPCRCGATEKNEEEAVIEHIVDTLIKLKGWRRKLIMWLWPDIRDIAETLREYCWKDCG